MLPGRRWQKTLVPKSGRIWVGVNNIHCNGVCVVMKGPNLRFLP